MIRNNKNVSQHVEIAGKLGKTCEKRPLSDVEQDVYNYSVRKIMKKKEYYFHKVEKSQEYKDINGNIEGYSSESSGGSTLCDQRIAEHVKLDEQIQDTFSRDLMTKLGVEYP